jgi:hypothetical protein
MTISLIVCINNLPFKAFGKGELGADEEFKKEGKKDMDKNQISESDVITEKNLFYPFVIVLIYQDFPLI